jgi:mannose-6-phosphate isomerase-like protein (cupin superfamily)
MEKNMTIRRVITAHDREGRSTIVSDAPLQSIPVPGVCDLYRIWSSDVPATYPGAGHNPDAPGFFPPVGGLRCFTFVLPPNKLAVLEAGDEAGGAAQDLVMDSSGFHATDTTDFEVILSGEATLETEDGSKVVLRAGDTVVHNGSSHRWSNQGREPAVLCGCIVGAYRK